MKKNFYLTVWGTSLVLAPLWWFLGMNLFVYHLVAGLFFMTLIHESASRNRSLFIPPSVRQLLLLIAIYIISLGIHMGSGEKGRVLASCYNLSFWILGTLMVLAMSNAFRIRDIPWLRKHFLVMACQVVLFAGVMLFLVIRGTRSVIFTTPLYALSGLVGSAQESLFDCTVQLVILQIDWWASWLVRMNYLAPYPTQTGGTIVLIMMMLLMAPAARTKSYALLRGGLFVGCLGAVLMTLARMSVTASLVSAFLSLALFQKKHSVLRAFALSLMLLILIPWILHGLDWLLQFRKVSTEGRLSLYLYSLNMLEGVDWIIGLGLKPLADKAYNLPSGSHSTYLTLIFKTGILGLSVFLFFQISLWRRWLGLKSMALRDPETKGLWRAFGAVLMAMSVWMLTDDLDAPQIVVFLFFSIVGIFEAFARELAEREREAKSVDGGVEASRVRTAGLSPIDACVKGVVK
jgi:hypothetical protein